MRDAEADIAEALSNDGWLTVLDGPLHGIRHRRGLPVIGYALYGCYLHVGDPGPWAGPWAGIARLEMPSGIGRDAAVEVAKRAAGWLPGFASTLHRDARAPVNLRPRTASAPAAGDARLALRAVREAVLERNREGRTA